MMLTGGHECGWSKCKIRQSVRDLLKNAAGRHTIFSGEINERKQVDDGNVDAKFQKIWSRNTPDMV